MTAGRSTRARSTRPSADEISHRRYVGDRRIDVTIRPAVDPLLPIAALVRAVATALDAAGAPPRCSLGLVLSGDAELAVLNEAYMGKTGPTDVLSFPLLPPDAFPPHPGGGDEPGGDEPGGDAARAVADRPARSSPGPAFVLPPGTRLHLGDLVVSVERAIDQAEGGRGGWTGDVRWTPEEELRLLVTHGTLHVCGWDHAAPTEEAAMRALERRLLEGAR